MRLLPKRRAAFESRTQIWRQVGLESEIDQREAHRAQWGVLLFGALLVGVLIVSARSEELFPGQETAVRAATVGALVLLGIALGRYLGRSLQPALYRRLDPGAAGTIGFLIRLATVAILLVVALRIGGLDPRTVAVGGAFTVVLLGLASQQTLGNLFAGMVLLGTRPFRVGERVKLIGGVLAGQVVGVVGSLGLFYTTLVSGADRIMVPNNIVIQSAVIPLREPERVELRARLGADTTPRMLQARLEDQVSVPLRYPPHVEVEELDREDVIVRIVATPINPADGAKLAEEVLAGVRETCERTGNGTGPRAGQRTA